MTTRQLKNVIATIGSAIVAGQANPEFTQTDRDTWTVSIPGSRLAWRGMSTAQAQEIFDAMGLTD